MTFVGGILLASLLGSVHCAAMCGAFVCTYAGTAHDGGRVAPHAAYHFGRLISYVTLGAIAGAIGRGVDGIGALAGIGRGAAIVAGVLMVLWASGNIATAFGARIRVTGPEFAQRWLWRAVQRVRNAPPMWRSGTLGLVTTLLPCGWLYAFVATAGATASPFIGAAVMATFWIGTAPALIAVAAGARRALGPLAQRLPLVSAAFVLVLGLLAITGRMQPIAHSVMMHGH